MSSKRPASISDLRQRVARARLPGGDRTVTERARRMLDLYLETADAHGLALAEVARELKSGTAALRIGGAELEQQATSAALRDAACAPGCAFCCILAGEDGAVIFEAEARALHEALVPLAGEPDGRAWSARACPALDPETRACRAYAARPMVCRAYVSPDAEACRQVADGIPAPGPGLLGGRAVSLAVQMLARAALQGVATVPSFSLSAVAAAAVEGREIDAALREARHKPRVMDDERKRAAGD
ncbi:YkgJ family cysteine cluster protein [Roseivivax marinus]|uniref:YkgJ family cysteine cluster protein n=1 Tax=Roseivivax marinus TaxID=1379903 RepID=UPI00273FA953|nr:YkgJ family cysteine cluster protein [Roseivivax marinus]